MVLMFYVGTHLLNHAVGLVSLAAAEDGAQVFTAFWRSLPMTVVFYGALVLHLSLALQALFERRTLVMTFTELLRIVLGVLIPFLLAGHFVQTRAVHALYGVDDGYRRSVSLIWAGGGSFGQMTLIAVAWLHACLGVHFAFRHRPAYRRLQTTFIVAATLLPVLAAAGYLAMARELATQAPYVDRIGPRESAVLQSLSELIVRTALALLLATLLARWLRNAWVRHRYGLLRIRYPGRTVDVPRGWSVLEASRANGIPHLSVCGGRARCSTCRNWQATCRCGRCYPWRVRVLRTSRWARPWSARWWCSSRTCGAGRISRRTSCPSTWSTCSIAISRWWATRCARPAAFPTSSSATA
jgi:adenylate cyclase